MEFDLLISGGQLVDGGGQRPAFRADVGIRGDRIAAIGQLAGASARRVINGAGRIVCPGAVTLEQAVHKMSGFVAQRFGIRDRGLLREGLAADLVVFDPATVGDRSTWGNSRAEPAGIDLVVVNGRPAVEAGRPTAELSGRVLRSLA